MQRLRLLLLAAFVLGAGCTASLGLNDAAVTALSGCRFPRSCWTVSCPCAFATLNSCLACDPTDPARNGADCVCAPDADGGANVCAEVEMVCVGRGPACEGRCVRVSSSCADPDGGEPPELVAEPSTDGGPSLEHHCAYADDVCCPSLSAADGGLDASLDLSVTD